MKCCKSFRTRAIELLALKINAYGTLSLKAGRSAGRCACNLHRPQEARVDELEGQGGSIREDCLNDAPNWLEPSGDEVRFLMRSGGLESRDVAAFLRVSRKTVNRWTMNQEAIPFAAWVLLCRQLGWGFPEY